jgi:hypothetical protein
MFYRHFRKLSIAPGISCLLILIDAPFPSRLSRHNWHRAIPRRYENYAHRLLEEFVVRLFNYSISKRTIYAAYLRDCF